MIAVVGPTAVGKTALAVYLARRFQGEIINADSRQVYRHMDIGTAKPTPEEQRVAPHHLVDVVDPDQSFGLGLFLALAREKVQQIARRGRLPIVAGGTGQYLWALLEGWQVPEVVPNAAFRQRKEDEAREKGPLAIHGELARIDPRRAAELDPDNLRRVIRALEIFHVTGQPPSDYRQGAVDTPHFLVVGLTLGREELYRRIDQRVDRMIEAGLVDEVRRLEAMGYPSGVGPLASPGYREVGQHLAREISLEEATQRAKFQTHRLARKQYGWFKLQDPRVHWLAADEPEMANTAAGLVADFLSRPPTVGFPPMVQ